MQKIRTDAMGSIFWLFLLSGVWGASCGSSSSSDICKTDSCSDHGQCEDSSGAAVCTCELGYADGNCATCASGYHDDSGVCVSDGACTADSCSGHGSCDDSSGAAVCTCETGYTDANCGSCAIGYHDENGACVIDGTCTAESCSGHGSCDDSGGTPVCSCDTGYTGADCAACAAGYHEENGDCVLDGSDTHPAGWAQPQNHGAALKQGDSDCRQCHAADLTGQGQASSCDSCHPNGWRSDCTFCHGGQDNQTGAPPLNLSGSADSALQTVGAHSVHVTGNDHLAYDCEQCHLKPIELLSAGHLFDASPGTAEVNFTGGLSSAAVYSAPACSSLYCHGDGRNDNGSMGSYTETINACDACHATPPASGEHRRGAHTSRECRECHADVTGSANAITGPALHVNGEPNVTLRNGGSWNAQTRSCNPTCHGSEDW